MLTEPEVDGNIYFAVGTQWKSSKKVENSCWQIGNDMVTYYSLLKHRKSSKEKIKKFLTSEKLSDNMLFAVKTWQTSSSLWKENVQKKELDRKIKEW